MVLQEGLVIEVVVEFGDEGGNVGEDLQDVESPLFKSLLGQERVNQLEVKLLIGVATHHFVGLEIKHVQHVHVVQLFIHEVCHFLPHVYDLVEKL